MAKQVTPGASEGNQLFAVCKMEDPLLRTVGNGLQNGRCSLWVIMIHRKTLWVYWGCQVYTVWGEDTTWRSWRSLDLNSPDGFIDGVIHIHSSNNAFNFSNIEVGGVFFL